MEHRGLGKGRGRWGGWGEGDGAQGVGGGEGSLGGAGRFQDELATLPNLGHEISV